MYKYLITARYTKHGYEREQSYTYYTKENALITYYALKLSDNYTNVEFYTLTLIENPE